MTSTTELQALIGKQGTLTTKDGWFVPVVILDARTAYGRVDVQVEQDGRVRPYRPEQGTPMVWVALDRVKVEP